MGLLGTVMREEDLRWPYIYTVTWQVLTIPPPEIQSQNKSTVRKCNISRHVAEVHFAALQHSRKTLESWMHEKAGFSETFILIYQSTRRHKAKVCNIVPLCQNLKPQVPHRPLFIDSSLVRLKTLCLGHVTLNGGIVPYELEWMGPSLLEGVIAAFAWSSDKIRDISLTIMRVRTEIWTETSDYETGLLFTTQQHSIFCHWDRDDSRLWEWSQ
jgi:hypothetical protein